MRFVPRHLPPDGESVKKLVSLMKTSVHMVVLTGAGISTESGLPDYRSEDVGLYSRTNRRPMDYQTFLRSDSARQRYWARNFIGWPYFSRVVPNTDHFRLASWQENGRLHNIITQNVDRLHHRAGSPNVLELHGTSHFVVCLQCGTRCLREDLQARFVSLNPSWSDYNIGGILAPDGDVELPEDLVDQFQVPGCTKCGGILKPDVVFMGENVPNERKEMAASFVSNADVLLCLGTTLQTYSVYRLALLANKANIPIAVVNIGPTRADSVAQIKVHSKLSTTLEMVDTLLGSC